MFRRYVMLSCFLAALSPTLLGQAVSAGNLHAASDPDKGWTTYISFSGSSNSLGQIMDLDSAIGYTFNRHFTIDAGIPYYFVRSANKNGNMLSHDGVGDMYTDLKFKLRNPIINYFSTLTGYAPTGDTSTGLSTGRATFNWKNRFDKGFGALLPFVEAGFGNTIPNSRFYRRPFTTLGYNFQFEVGAEYSLSSFLGVGASAYDIAPTGQQKLYSRFANHKTSLTATMVGGADIAKDDGFTVWADANAGHYVDFELGFNRSMRDALNTVSFGIGFNVGSLLKKSPRY